MSIIFLDRHFQPLLDQMQNVPINDPTGDALHQFSVRDAVKIPRQVRVDDILVSGVEQTMNRSYHSVYGDTTKHAQDASVFSQTTSTTEWR
jgi:hypothetical protein